MALRFFTRTPKHQQFEYKPRYWNPDREQLQDRLRQAREATGDDPEGMKRRISNGMRRNYKADAKLRSQLQKRSNMRLLAVLVILCFMTYLFLNVYLPDIIKLIEGTPTQ